MSAVRWDVVLTDFDGVALKTDDGRPITLRRAVRTALGSEPSGGVHPEKKIERYELALKIGSSGTPGALSPADTALVEEAVKGFWGPLVSGQAVRLLRGKETGIASASNNGVVAVEVSPEESSNG